MSFQMYCSFTTNVRIKLLRIMTHNRLTVDCIQVSSQQTEVLPPFVTGKSNFHYEHTPFSQLQNVNKR